MKAERVAQLETTIFEGEHSQEAMQSILALRRELVLFRRVVGPERDMLGDVLRRDLPFLHPDLIPYFMDVRDQTRHACNHEEGVAKFRRNAEIKQDACDRAVDVDR